MALHAQFSTRWWWTSKAPRLISLGSPREFRRVTTSSETPRDTDRRHPPPGQDKGSLMHQLDPLLDGSGGRWHVTADGKAIERCFRFQKFYTTWARMIKARHAGTG